MDFPETEATWLHGYKDELYKHITDAINMCTKYHPNSELAIAFRKYGHIK